MSIGHPALGKGRAFLWGEHVYGAELAVVAGLDYQLAFPNSTHSFCNHREGTSRNLFSRRIEQYPHLVTEFPHEPFIVLCDPLRPPSKANRIGDDLIERHE